jgi:hypothetical protein
MQGKEANEKETNHPAHPMHRMVNWCSHGGWFTLAHKIAQNFVKSGVKVVCSEPAPTSTPSTECDLILSCG